ncbi:hypothetical protein [Bacillus cereus group sp. BY6-1LC]|uniref:hypothetical protein n=1 Tax=Bacillus cereus group sp. BY6-1LC TaxID=3018077 RepID=UPI0022E8E569|nr:hypothetical protein [Bacillus cereus group sp. BY6-1LC]MDA1802616.1 hypothetical protein [Bacillus cereus group sp. BY6-1LC]
MAVSGECALCKKESELKLSHIIPKFVFRTLKKDSFTGRFRAATEPNKALQDGKKEYMLCGECEGLFSSNETKFSNKIFIPFKENGFKTPLKYDDNWLNFFITSVNWRVLYLDIQKEENERNPQLTDALNKMKQSEEIMRAFLLGNRYNLDRIENHIFFFDVAESASGFERPNSLFLGTVFASTIILGNAEEKFIYIVSNLSGVLIITIIKKYQKDKWYNTFVKNESGKVKPPQKMESILGQEFSNLQKLREQYKQGLSPNQKKQIEEKIKNDPEGFMKSGTYKRIMLDLNLK